MAINTTHFFLPEEHRIISSWLKVEPRDEIPNDLTLEKALENLGLDQEVWDVHSTTDFAVAAILLESVQGSLPQWACVREGNVTLGRNYRERAVVRTVELTPRHLLTINWADSAPGYSWPEDYRVTYVPLYDTYVVTGSMDSADVFGVTDFALGHFPSQEDVLQASAAIVQGEWLNLFQNCGQSRWAYLFDEGLIDTVLAEKLANEVWEDDDEEEDRDDDLLAS